MFLTNTSAKIELILGSNTTTNAIELVSTWADITSNTFTPGITADTVSTTSTKTLVGSPSSSTQRQIKMISVYNTDTVSADITIRYNDGSTTYILIRITLQVGESLTWQYDRNWTVNDKWGAEKRGNSGIVFPDQNVYSTEWFPDSAVASKPLSGNIIHAAYLGKAARSYTSASVHYALSIAAVGVTWSEVAILTGAQNYFDGSADLIVRGFADNSSVMTSTGQKTTTVTCSGIHPGDNLYAAHAILVVTTTPQLQACNSENSTGFQYATSGAGAVSHRPSTDVGIVHYGLGSGGMQNVAVVFS